MLTCSGGLPFGNLMNLKQIFPALRKKLSSIAALGGLALLASSPVGDAQVLDSKFLPPAEAFRVEATAEGADRLRVDFLVTPGYYLYRHRMSFAIDAGEGAVVAATLGAPNIPAGEEKEDEFFGRQQVFHQALSVTIPVSRAPGGALEVPLVVGLQGCADAGLCYPPEKRRLKIVLPAASGTATAGPPPGATAAGATGGFVSEQDRLAALIREGRLPLVLATFFGLGLLLAFTPCVLPMVPILSGIIAGQGSTVTTKRAFTLSLAYVLGMGVPLLAVGASAGRLLPKAGAWMDTVKQFFGVLLLAVAVWMLARILPERATLALWAVPALAGAWLLWRWRAGAGAGIPRGAARIAGLLLGAWALTMLVGAALGGRDPLAPIPQLERDAQGLEFRAVKGTAGLDRELAAAAAAGRPVMLDFYADWCVSCKEMERDTFTDEAVKRSLAGAVLLKADVTANDAADQALLQRFGIFGPPTIAFWSTDGTERTQYRVVGFMKAAEFAAIATQATRSQPDPAGSTPGSTP